jgi:DNA-binding PadR family transcriptional regulator
MSDISSHELDDRLPLSALSLHILLSLGNGPAHGYAIGKEIEERSGGALNPTTGALYQALKRLRDDGLVEPAPEETERAADARRRYFRLTELGRKAVALEAERLEGLLRAARAAKLYPTSP